MDRRTYSTGPPNGHAAPYILAYEIHVETNDIDVLSEPTTTDSSVSSSDLSGFRRPSELYLPAEELSSKDKAIAFTPGKFDNHPAIPVEAITDELGDIGGADVDSYNNASALALPPTGMAIGITANNDSIFVNDAEGFSRSASGHRLSRKRKEAETGAITTTTTRKRFATKTKKNQERVPSCTLCKTSKKSCGWKIDSVYEPCIRAVRAKTVGQTSDWFQSKLSEITLYQRQTPSAVILNTQHVARLKHDPEASHKLRVYFPGQSLSQAANIGMSVDRIIRNQSSLAPVHIITSSNSQLSRAMLLRCFEYAYKNDNSATATALRVWAMCHAVDPMRTIYQPALDQPHEELCKMVATAMLDPLRSEMLAKLESVLSGPDIEKWTDCFQTFFLLLDLIDYTSSYACYTMDQPRPEVILFRSRLCHSSQIILGRYHHCVKKFAHPLLNWFDGADDFPKPIFSSSERRLFHGLKKYIDFKDGDYRFGGTNAPPNNDHNFWTRQLFFTDWSAPYKTNS